MARPVTAMALVTGGLLVPVAATAGVGAGATAAGAAGSGRVLLVGTYHGVKGQYTSIQAAVDAAKTGDWVLVAPGDYHETDDATATAAQLGDGDHGGVVIHTSDLHLRGMNRDTVIVDGTKAGAAPCSSAAADQNLGPVAGTKAQGRNGIVVWKANGVSVQNLTACNFLGGAGDSGNEIWWNGGDGSGKIGLTGYRGSYLTGTSTYFGTESDAAEYGIFSSNSAGQLEPDLRQQYERLGHVRRRLPAAVRHHHRPCLDGEQRAGLLGHQLGRRRRHREQPIRQQRGRSRHQHADRRRPAGAAER